MPISEHLRESAMTICSESALIGLELKFDTARSQRLSVNCVNKFYAQILILWTKKLA
jgi:hypothetical protein